MQQIQQLSSKSLQLKVFKKAPNKVITLVEKSLNWALCLLNIQVKIPAQHAIKKIIIKIYLNKILPIVKIVLITVPITL